MRINAFITTVILMIVMPFSVHAQEVSTPLTPSTPYADMLAIDFMKKQFTHEVTNVGVNFYSTDKINLSNTVKASKVALYLEGPFAIPDGTKLVQVMNFNIDTILTTSVLNKNYPLENRVAEGIGATVLNISGTNVGFLDYQLPEMSLANPTNAMAIFRRAVIVKDGKMYGFTLAVNDPTIDQGRLMVLDMLVIIAINSDKF